MNKTPEFYRDPKPTGLDTNDRTQSAAAAAAASRPASLTAAHQAYQPMRSRSLAFYHSATSACLNQRFQRCPEEVRRAFEPCIVIDPFWRVSIFFSCDVTDFHSPDTIFKLTFIGQNFEVGQWSSCRSERLVIGCHAAESGKAWKKLP